MSVSDQDYRELQEEGYDHCMLGGPTEPRFLRTVYEKIADGWQIDDLRIRPMGGRSGSIYVEIRFRIKGEQPGK